MNLDPYLFYYVCACLLFSVYSMKILEKEGSFIKYEVNTHTQIGFFMVLNILFPLFFLFLVGYVFYHLFVKSSSGE